MHKDIYALITTYDTSMKKMLHFSVSDIVFNRMKIFRKYNKIKANGTRKF